VRVQREKEEAERVRKAREVREAEAKARAVDDRNVWRRYARKHLLPPSEGPIRVALRTPINAERNVRNFTPGPSTEALFIYAETLLIPSTYPPEDDPDTPPEGFTPPEDFRIVTAYPRKEVERIHVGAEVVWETVRQAGGAVFAEKVEGGTWCDAEIRQIRGEESDEEVVEE
jgi:FAS-associated factor 2